MAIARRFILTNASRAKTHKISGHFDFYAQLVVLSSKTCVARPRSEDARRRPP